MTILKNLSESMELLEALRVTNLQLAKSQIESQERERVPRKETKGLNVIEHVQ